MQRTPSHAKRRRTLPAIPIMTGMAIAACALPSIAISAQSQNGGEMVVINPGGSRQATGSDGLAIVLNAANAYKPGSSSGQASVGLDNLFFANTAQWCC